MNPPYVIEPLFEPLEALQKLLSRLDDRGVIIGGTAVAILVKAFGEVLETPNLWEKIEPLLKPTER